jgi:hypothetical protein
MPFAASCHREVRAGTSVNKAIPSSRISASQPQADFERNGRLLASNSERTTPKACIAVAVVIGAPSSCSGVAYSGVRMRPCRGLGERARTGGQCRLSGISNLPAQVAYPPRGCVAVHGHHVQRGTVNRRIIACAPGLPWPRRATGSSPSPGTVRSPWTVPSAPASADR